MKPTHEERPSPAADQLDRPVGDLRQPAAQEPLARLATGRDHAVSGIVVEIARHARFARVGHEQASLRSNDDDVSPRPDLAPGQAWLQRVGGDGEPAVAVSFDYLSSWGPDDRPTWVAEIELHPVDCRERVLRAGAYSLQLAATGGTTRTVVLSRPQSGACWRGEVMKRRTSLQRPSRDPAIDRLFQTQG